MDSVRIQVFDRPEIMLGVRLRGPTAFQVWGQVSIEVWWVVDRPFGQIITLTGRVMLSFPPITNQIEDQARENHREQ
jgi:hypothetical protein